MIDSNSAVQSDDRKVREVLEQIAGSSKLGQEREPKWFHPFPARLPIAVAKHLIAKLTKTNAFIVDPMVGSGTSLVAARQLGRKAIGFDRDFLAVRIAKCASRSYSSDRLNKLRTLLLAQAQLLFDDRHFTLPLIRSNLAVEDQNFIKFWFPPHAQKQLFALSDVIGGMKSGADKDFAWIVFSHIVITKSTGASYAIDITRSRPHRQLDKLVPSPFTIWDRRFQSAMKHLPFLDASEEGSVRVQRGDARALKQKRASADFILTSPPYRTAIDYLRCHKFSLVWMGHDMEKLRELRGTMIGTERGLWELDGLPAAVECRLRNSSGGSRQIAMTRKYLSDMRKVCGEFARILRPGGLAVMVVGPTMINARRSDAADLFGALGEAAGLKFVAAVTRNLSPSRRSLPLPKATIAQGSLGKRMRREVVVALRKPE